jgi:hypothetical protein
MDSSKNEILIAIFLGILIGFISVLSFYFIFKNRSRFSNSSSKTSIKIDNQKPTLSDKNISETFDLTINPEENEITSETQIFTISGQTIKNATVILQTSDTITRLSPDSNGNFSSQITLNPEINQIFISSILDSQEKTIEKIIYYEKK